MHLSVAFSYLRGVSSDAVLAGTELGVLDAVHFHHIYRRIIHAVVFVCQFIPCRLQSLAMAAPGDKVIKMGYWTRLHSLKKNSRFYVAKMFTAHVNS